MSDIIINWLIVWALIIALACFMGGAHARPLKVRCYVNPQQHKAVCLREYEV